MKKLIDVDLVLCRLFLNATIVAQSRSFCCSEFHRLTTRAEKKCFLSSERNVHFQLCDLGRVTSSSGVTEELKHRIESDY